MNNLVIHQINQITKKVKSCELILFIERNFVSQFPTLHIPRTIIRKVVFHFHGAFLSGTIPRVRHIHTFYIYRARSPPTAGPCPLCGQRRKGVGSSSGNTGGDYCGAAVARGQHVGSDGGRGKEAGLIRESTE